MIKRILIPLDGSTHSLSATKYGLWLAKAFKAVVTGLYVIDIVSLEGPFLHDISASIGFEPVLNFSTRMKEVLADRGRAVLDTFEASCREAAVRCERLMTTGLVVSEICDKALLADIVVMGKRGANEEFDTGLMGSVTEGVIRKSARPVFVSPKEFRAPERPLLAYDGSESSADALHLAAEFAKTTRLPLTIITVTRPGAVDHSLVDASDYLKPYGIKADFVELQGDAARAITDYCREKGHDLLFMGTTHRSRMLEMVLGSTTEYVVRTVDGPFIIVR